MARIRWIRRAPDYGAVTGVAQGDSSYALLFIGETPPLIQVTAVVAPDNSGTFRVLGAGTCDVLITGLTASSSRSVSGPGATVTNNAGGGSSPFTATAGGVLDLRVVTTDTDTTLTVS